MHQMEHATMQSRFSTDLWLFDSNHEATSLPLLQDTLNYLVSTKLNPAEFLGLTL